MAQKSQEKQCLSVLTYVIKVNKVLLVFAQLMTNTCVNITHRQVHRVRKAKKLLALEFFRGISKVHFRRSVITTAVCPIMFSFIVTVWVTQ